MNFEKYVPDELDLLSSKILQLLKENNIENDDMTIGALQQVIDYIRMED